MANVQSIIFPKVTIGIINSFINKQQAKQHFYSQNKFTLPQRAEAINLHFAVAPPWMLP